jgi:hypothetical protein
MEGFSERKLMIQGQVIRSAAALELRPDAPGPEALARGLIFGLPISLGFWAALAALIL